MSERWVVKIGSAVLLQRDAPRIDRPVFVSLVHGIDALLRAGHRVTIVSSGAVALGRQQLFGDARASRPDELPDLQAYAAVGQPRLMAMWEREFAHHDRRVAQVLFTREDLDSRERYLNARLTLEALERLDVQPIINENDTVATEEIRFGDNDALAAMTSGLVRADRLVILSDVEGICERDGERLGARIPTIAADDPRLDDLVAPTLSAVGTGGMATKIDAARLSARLGATVWIAPGKRLGVLEALLQGESVGTRLDPRPETVQGRRVWIGAGARVRGSLSCDAGAVAAVRSRGSSLLAAGISEVEGAFGPGDVVDLRDPDGKVFARGVVSYGADALREITGLQTIAVAETLGLESVAPVVHRDALLVL